MAAGLASGSGETDAGGGCPPLAGAVERSRELGRRGHRCGAKVEMSAGPGHEGVPPNAPAPSLDRAGQLDELGVVSGGPSRRGDSGQRTCRRPCALQRRGVATVRMSSPGMDSGGAGSRMCGSGRQGKPPRCRGLAVVRPPNWGDGRVLRSRPCPGRSRPGRGREGRGGMAPVPRSEPFLLPPERTHASRFRGGGHKQTTRPPFRFALAIRARLRPYRRRRDVLPSRGEWGGDSSAGGALRLAVYGDATRPGRARARGADAP